MEGNMRSLALILVLFIVNVQAQWSTDPSQNNPIVTTNSGNEYLQMTTDGVNGAYVASTGYGDSRNIFIQRIYENGTVQFTQFGLVICDAAGEQLSPIILNTGFGGAYIFWIDGRPGDGGLYGQRVDALGNSKWIGNGKLFSTGGRPSDVMNDGAGGVIVAMYRIMTNNDIYAIRVDSSGNNVWGIDGGVAVCTATGDQENPTMISDGYDNAIITWTDSRNGLSNRDIFAQKISYGGVTQWQLNGVAISTNTGNQIYPVLTSDGNGGAIIAWVEGYEVRAQRVDRNGNVKWVTDGITIAANGYGMFGYDNLHIISDDSGGAILTWADPRNGLVNADIFAQRIDSNGVGLWNQDSSIICNAPNTQAYPQLISEGNGNAIIAWRDNRNGNQSPADIYAQKINFAGKVQWQSNGIAVSSNIAAQDNSKIVSDGRGGAIITWLDYRNGSWRDIYGQHINSDGSLGNSTNVLNRDGVIKEFSLIQNYPNPFNPVTNIYFSLPKETFTTLKVYNILGREVETILNEKLEAGEHHVKWNAINYSSGLYYYRLISGDFIETKKMILLK
jgi:hypothetical protein